MSARSEIEDELVRKFQDWEKDKLVTYLASFVKTYVRDASLPFNLELPEADVLAEDKKAAAEGLTFGKIIEQLKKRIALPQLEEFEIEDGKVTLTVNNQKIVFGDRTTIEFVQRSPKRRPPSTRVTGTIEPDAAPAAEKKPDPVLPTSKPAVPAAKPSAPAAKTAPAKSAPTPDRAVESATEEEAAHNVRERFRRLDMD